MKKSIAKNLSFNLIYQVLTILLPLITTPYLSRVLGAEPIGIYGYTLSIATYFVLFGSLGVSMYGQREIAKNQDNDKNRAKIFWEIIIIRTIAVIISMLSFYVCFCTHGEYKIYYMILSLYILAGGVDISWFLQGIEEFGKTVVRNIIVKLASIFLIFFLIKSPEDLKLYILIFVISELLGNLSLWLYLPKYLVKTKLKSLELKRHVFPIFLLFIPQVATQIYTVLDKTMVGALTNDMVEVGFYEQAQKIARAALVITASMQVVMSPRIANAYVKKKNKEINENLTKAFSFVWFIGIPLMFGLIAVSANLVPWYYGDGFMPVRNILIATSPIILIIGLSGITGIVYLVQTGRQKEFTTSVIIGAIVNIIFNFILIKPFGGVGAAIASVLAEISVLCYHLIYIKKIYSIKKIFTLSIKCMIAGLVMFGVLWFIYPYFSSSIINTLILTIIGAFIYFVMLLILRYDFLYAMINQVFVMLKNIIKKERFNYEKK